MVSVRMLSLHLMLELEVHRAGSHKGRPRACLKPSHRHETDPHKVKPSSISVIVASDLGDKCSAEVGVLHPGANKHVYLA